MRKAQVTFILILVTAALIAVNAFFYVTKDRTAPEISIPKSLIEAGYDEKGSEKALLNGVSADDDRDGDVTGSLRVAGILENSDGDSVTVTYTAMDSNKNVAQESIVLEKV